MTRSLNLSAFLLLVVVIGVSIAATPRAAAAPPAPAEAPLLGTVIEGNGDTQRQLGASHGVPPSQPAVPSGASIAPDVSMPATTAPARFEGWISWAELDYGDEYVATRYPRGTLVRICAVDCIVRVTTDFGPSAAIEPPRIADVAVLDWEAICHLPRGRGVCRGTVERVQIGLPATDMEGAK